MRAHIYILVMGEDMRGQIIAIDAVTEHEAMRAGESRQDYTPAFHAAVPIGAQDGEAMMHGEQSNGQLKALLESTATAG